MKKYAFKIKSIDSTIFYKSLPIYATALEAQQASFNAIKTLNMPVTTEII